MVNYPVPGTNGGAGALSGRNADRRCTGAEADTAGHHHARLSWGHSRDLSDDRVGIRGRFCDDRTGEHGRRPDRCHASSDGELGRGRAELARFHRARAVRLEPALHGLSVRSLPSITVMPRLAGTGVRE